MKPLVIVAYEERPEVSRQLWAGEKSTRVEDALKSLEADIDHFAKKFGKPAAVPFGKRR